MEAIPSQNNGRIGYTRAIRRQRNVIMEESHTMTLLHAGHYGIGLFCDRRHMKLFLV